MNLDTNAVAQTVSEISFKSVIIDKIARCAVYFISDDTGLDFLEIAGFRLGFIRFVHAFHPFGS